MSVTKYTHNSTYYIFRGIDRYYFSPMREPWLIPRDRIVVGLKLKLNSKI